MADEGTIALKREGALYFGRVSALYDDYLRDLLTAMVSKCGEALRQQEQLSLPSFRR